MKNLVGFNLFESYSFDYNDAFLNKDYEKHLNIAFMGIARANEDKNFLRWLLYSSYLDAIYNLGLTKSDIEYMGKLVDKPYPEGFLTSFDFNKELDSLGMKSVSWLRKNFLVEKIKRLPAETPVIGMETKNILASSIRESIINATTDIFLPSNINNIQKLKYLDYVKKYTKESYFNSLLVDDIVVSQIDKNFKSASDLYKGMEFSIDLGKRLFNFLKIFSIHDMEYFKNIPLPERMANYVVLYFKESEDSFKAADELRKSNVGIYNRIKDLLPNIDTAADLGDLGF
jgi:hypothetical protein